MKDTLKLIGNRALHWIAAIGLFLLLDALGVQQLGADYVQHLSYHMATSGKR